MPQKNFKAYSKKIIHLDEKSCRFFVERKGLNNNMNIDTAMRLM